MDWANERYVRMYTRDTGDWVMWPWQTRALFLLILRKVDRAGILSLGKNKLRALAAVIGMPESEVTEYVEPLVEDGCIQFNDAGDLIVANFIEAQETLGTQASRQRDSRERRRDMVARGLRPEQRGCVVYFIQSEDGGPIKIGRTEDVAKRLVQMQTSRPDKLVILATAPGVLADERRLHDHFAHCREKGEWFSPTPELVKLTSHVARDSSLPSDLSQFVTSHSVPIRAVPNQTKPNPERVREAAESPDPEPEPSAIPDPPDYPRESRSRSPGVPPPTEPARAPTLPLPERLWAEGWEAKFKRRWIWSTNTGPKGDVAVIHELWRHAAAHGDQETWYRHWLRRFLADRTPFLVDNAHKPQFVMNQLPKYGDPKAPPSSAVRLRTAPAEPEAKPLTAAEMGERARAFADSVKRIGAGGV